MSDREAALVVGVGPGLGASLARCFARNNMDVALAARDAGRLAGLGGELAELGSKAPCFPCDASDEDSVEALFQAATKELGRLDLGVFNTGAFVRRNLLETTAEEFERCWRVGCLGGFLVGRAAAREMVSRGGGTILFTGATASLRGSALFHNLAVPKFGLRALAQSMARELGPQGIHVGHVVIDGQILSDRYASLAAERPEDGLLSPDAIATSYLHLHQQPRNAWTLELDLRPWVERF